jgi:hypothetical protein
MRHATSYLMNAIGLIPELLASLEPADPLVADLKAFQQTGRGLPIPIERNLYEAIWNSTLAERLVLFQVDTEVPGSRGRSSATRPINESACQIWIARSSSTW